MSKIKIGQIGTAHGHAAGKIETYRASEEYEVVGIAEPDPELKKKAEEKTAYLDVPWMTVEQLLAVQGLQAIAVETEPRDLLMYAEMGINAGLHIHLDKPAGESLTQFRRILDQAARKHLCVQMGYMFRYNPAIVLMKNLVRKGYLGEVFEMHCVMSKVVDDASRLRNALYPGGMMFELGCHMIDIVVDLLGSPTAVNAFHQHSGHQPDGLQDNMLAVMTYPRAIASVKSSALEVNGGARRHVVVCGTEGTIHIEPIDAPKFVRLTLSKERGAYEKGTQEIPLEPYKRYVADAADFAKVIRAEKSLDWSIMHDLAVQETVLRASASPLEDTP